ncbi:hypothetical protein BDA99DRAFT_110636 [Phascolomyces articulosus]|uniref:Uncharacterized protein n=1 Tax=Phascolomyces articulosus TaxID=60185 RepID=A0AAD5PCF8_9FUNG|nr:hypothetical protein BDA99DRAFT_110636 [Phascolomyces articulosus]
MTIRLKNYMPTFLKYLDIYEEMMIKGKFSKETVQKQNQFFALKEKSHAVEHYLRSIRDYFISSKNKEGFCNIHLYKEAEEQNTTIEVESELKYFEDCIVKERRYQESHKSIATALKLNK